MTVYATVTELKARFSNMQGTASDTTLLALLTAASRAIDGFCNRVRDGFVASATATARTYVGSGGAVCFIDECVEVTAVAVKTSANETSYASWAATDWQAGSGRPENGRTAMTPYIWVSILPTGSQTAFTNGRLGGYSVPTVQVTAKWGYAASGATALDVVREATIAQALRWYQRFKSGWADSNANAEFGQLTFERALDPHIKMMLVEGGLVRAAQAASVSI